MSYLGAAVSVAHGDGLQVPIAPWNAADSTIHLKAFPPGYSLLLSIPIRLGVEPEMAGRLVQALASSVTVTIVATLAMELAGPIAALLLALLMILTPALIEDHLSILSEPLYLMLVVVFLLALVRRGENPLLYGTVAALGVMTRYLGGSLAAAAVLWSLLQGTNGRDRLIRAVKAALPTLIVLALWVFDARGGPGRPPASSLAADFHLGDALEELRDALLYWLGPNAESVGANLALAIGSGLCGLWLFHRAARQLEWRRWRTDALPALWLASGLIITCHVGVLLFSRIFVGHEIPFDGRLLSAVILITELLFVVTVAGCWPTWRWPARLVVLGLLLGWVNGAVAWARERATDAHDNGWDYNGLDFQQSPTVAWVRGAEGRTLFTNHPVPLWFHAGRVARDLPQSAEPDTVAAFVRSLDRRHGAVVIFADTTWEPGVPIDSLVSAAGLRVVARFEDGAVYDLRER
jgi:4-amino-4-deoxy-L-arabinose transferase-like glycosyltransferase